MSSLVFPSTLPGLTLLQPRAPGYSTTVLESASGIEYRAGWRSQSRTRYTLTFEFLRTDASLLEWQTLVGFYQRHLGMLDSFLFSDPADNAVSSMPFGTGDGVTTAFQLQRSLVPAAQLSSPIAFWPQYSDGFEPVKNLNSTPSIYVDGVLKVPGVDYTISASGVVTFVAAPANTKPLTWNGGYYWRVRFADDELATRQLMEWSGMQEAPTVNLIKVL